MKGFPLASRIALVIHFLFAAFTAAASEPIDLNADLRILPESYLVIEGKSNVNTFRYRYTELPIDSTSQTIGRLPTVIAWLLQSSLALDLESFDAGHGKMNSDFRKLLNADAHPAILISVETLAALDENRRPTGLASPNAAQIWVNAHFTISGVDVPYTFPVQLTRNGAQLRVSGELAIDLSDLGIEAPTAMFGLIKVRNEISICFELLLEKAD